MRTLCGNALFNLQALPDGSYALKTAYDRRFVDAFKAKIPSRARRWEPNNKEWLIDATYVLEAIKLVDKHFGYTIPQPQQVVLPKPSPLISILKVEYIGQCKDRGDGKPTAYGYCDGDWKVVFPESVLRAWFGTGDQRPGEALTLYAALTVSQQATGEEIKGAYRRLAKQWHPDHCHESDAADQFKTISHAYKVLTDPLTRKKYNAGLLFAARTTGQTSGVTGGGYRSPLRCGWIMAEVIPTIGRYKVEKIIEWRDITNSLGQTLVTSWPPEAGHFIEDWV